MATFLIKDIILNPKLSTVKKGQLLSQRIKDSGWFDHTDLAQEVLAASLEGPGSLNDIIDVIEHVAEAHDIKLDFSLDGGL